MSQCKRGKKGNEGSLRGKGGTGEREKRDILLDKLWEKGKRWTERIRGRGKI